MPLRDACPTCSGLVIVPKFAFTPDENDAASPKAVAVTSGASPSRWQHAAVEPNTPIVAVGCQPFS